MALRVAPGRTWSWLGIMSRVLAQSRRSRLAQILDGHVKTFDLVILTANVLHVGFDEDADAGLRLARKSALMSTRQQGQKRSKYQREIDLDRWAKCWRVDISADFLALI